MRFNSHFKCWIVLHNKSFQMKWTWQIINWQAFEQVSKHAHTHTKILISPSIFSCLDLLPPPPPPSSSFHFQQFGRIFASNAIYHVQRMRARASTLMNMNQQSWWYLLFIFNPSESWHWHRYLLYIAQFFTIFFHHILHMYSRAHTHAHARTTSRYSVQADIWIGTFFLKKQYA